LVLLLFALEVPGMTPSADVSGQWAGYYLQFDKPHGIVANLVQTGTRLSGIMTDSNTGYEESVFEMAAKAGWPPGQDEQVIRWLREQFPEDPQALIRAAVRLPSRSVLEGSVQDRTVYFLKTMQGEHFTGYRIGDQYVGTTITQHAIHYRGHLSADGAVIQGKWCIDPHPERGWRYTEGSFVLQRLCSIPLAGEIPP
jgi:hypothetical protein